MKHALVAVLALAMATPVVSFPTTSDAQVLTRRSGGASPARRPRAQPPRLTSEEQDSLYAAQDLITNLNSELADLQRLGAEQGGLTEEQRALVEMHTNRRNEAQVTVDRLIAKRGY